jgi:hypothetical protein
MTIECIDYVEVESDCGPPNAQRDLPLTFRWRADTKAIAALGLDPARSSRHDDARNAVLTEAKLAYERNSWVSFSRRPAWYVGRARYYGASYGYDPVLSAVADGVKVGLLEEQRASPRTRGRQSRFRATPHLYAMLNEARIRSCLHEVIWLRDDRRKLVNYADTALTRRMRNEIEAVNTIMAEIEVDLTGSGVQSVGSYWVVSGTSGLDMELVLLHLFELPVAWSRAVSAAAALVPGLAKGLDVSPIPLIGTTRVAVLDAIWFWPMSATVSGRKMRSPSNERSTDQYGAGAGRSRW